jgi:hypothetical protein
LSIDGRVVVGVAWNEAGSRRFRWTETSGTKDFSTLGVPEGCGEPLMNAEGSSLLVSCGEPSKLFYWTESSGTTSFSPPAKLSFTWPPPLMSRDGSVVAGALKDDAAPGPGTFIPFRWTSKDGVKVLHQPEPGDNGRPVAISDDGKVIVGGSQRPLTPETIGSGAAYRWTESGGTVRLGFLPGDDANEVIAASADGSIVAGVSTNHRVPNGPPLSEFVLWDGHGIRSIVGELTAAGVDLKGFEIGTVDRVWAAGSIVVVQGRGSKPEALPHGWVQDWVAHLPVRP